MNNDNEDNGYKVGYGRPPKETQFKKGERRNHNKRVKPVDNSFGAIIGRAFAERVKVTIKGKSRWLTKLEVIVRHVVKAAAKGDDAGIALLMRLNSHMHSRGETPAPILKIEGRDF